MKSDIGDYTFCHHTSECNTAKSTKTVMSTPLSTHGIWTTFYKQLINTFASL